MSDDDVVLIAGVRTPFGRHRGAISPVRADDLAALTLRSLLERTGIDGAEVDEVVLGCANQAGEDNRNVARMASLLAGLPVEVPGQTVNRLCGSGMQAIVAAAREIQMGGADVVVAGGVESMSRAPWVMAKPEMALPRGRPVVEDSALGWRFPNPRMEKDYGLLDLGDTAEEVAARYDVTRDDQDAFALRSHQRAVAAQDAGVLGEELVQVPVPQRKADDLIVDVDEGPRRDASLELLAGLRPVFAEDGSVTAGNSSPLNDGAAVVLLMRASQVERHGLTPLARFVDAAAAGVHPSVMGIGPVPATSKLVAREGVPALDQVGLIELNEAFASQAVACTRLLGLDPERVNVNGGAIALGHPLGASGARLVMAVTAEMARRDERYGLASMCIGVGQGISSVWELVR